MLPPPDFVLDIHPGRNDGLVGYFSQCQQFRHLLLQIRFDGHQPLVAHRLTLGGVGVDLAPIQADVAQFQHPHRLRQQQDLHEQLLDFRQKSLPKGGDGIVVGMHIPGNETKWNRFIGRPFYPPRTEDPRRVTVEQQPQHQFRGVGWSACFLVLLVYLAQIQLADELYREAGQVFWPQHIPHTDAEIERLFIIGGPKFSTHTDSLHLIYGRGQRSPTSC